MALKNKICVIFTGGTIGSSLNNDTVDLDSGSASLLINQYKYISPEITFDEIRPISILSENIQPENLYKIVETIKTVDPNKYDGIILTHGTDTLTFTANYLSQIFCNIKIPLVIVSALYPLQDARSNGLDNFDGAVNFIRQAKIKGVYVSFKNPFDVCKIHLASRIVYSQQINGKNNSLLDVPFGEINKRDFIYNNNPNNPTIEQIKTLKNLPFKTYELDTDIVVIKARALLDFSFYNFDKKKPKAVIIELYHSGTICTEGNKLSFINFYNYCNKLGIKVILTPIDKTANVYASVKDKLSDCIFAYNISVEMTIAKTMLALMNDLDLKSTLLNDNKFFEKI